MYLDLFFFFFCECRLMLVCKWIQRFKHLNNTSPFQISSLSRLGLGYQIFKIIFFFTFQPKSYFPVSVDLLSKRAFYLKKLFSIKLQGLTTVKRSLHKLKSKKFKVNKQHLRTLLARMWAEELDSLTICLPKRLEKWEKKTK